MNYEAIYNANPWREVADDWFARMGEGDSGYQYVLPQDEQAIRDYTPTDAERHELLLNIPPQPFVGNPKAKIWFLLKNPGGGDWNVCDFLAGTNGLAEENRRHATPQADDCLQWRQELYRRQLKFEGEKGKEFFLLDPSFRTATRGGRMPRCIYWWYRTRLLCSDGIFSQFIDDGDDAAILKFFSENVFVLDYFPYHSSRFDDVDQCVAHAAFWRKAVTEALKDKDKLLVFWGSRIANRIKHDAEMMPLFQDAVKARRILSIKGQQAYFSEANVTLPLEGRELVQPYVKRR